VGLLSVGEEEIKGNELTRAVYDRFKHLPVHFVGNVEGGDLFSGKVDVIVCDGFVGNIALKICEGLAMEIVKFMKKTYKGSLASQVGYLLSRGALKGIKEKLDYSEYGGAPLLGVRGICVIGHGVRTPLPSRTRSALQRDLLAQGSMRRSNRSSP
jgi:glycerol-3-phosphate acyltransferase PlsX